MSTDWSGHYWERFFRDVAEAPSLLRPEKLADVDSHKAKSHQLDASPALVARIHSISGGDPKARFAIAYAALALLMESYTQRHDVPVATPLFPNSDKDTSGEALLFLSLRLKETLSGRELILLSQKAIDTARQHQMQVPWRNGKPQVDRAHRPVLTMCDHAVNPMKELPVGGQLLFAVVELTDKKGWALRVTASNAFHPQQLINLVRHWSAALQYITSDFERKVSGFSCFDDDDLQLLHHYSHGEPVELPSTLNLYAHFQQRATQEPDKCALVRGEQALSYGQLHQDALRLASSLSVNFDISAGSIVAVSLPSSFDLPAVYLATLCLGATIVPVEPAMPVQRKLHYLNASQSQLFITDSPLQEWAGQQVSPREVRERSSEQAGPVLVHETAPHEVSFIMHTSGSTGLPKGACITCYSILNIVHWFSHHFRFDAADVLPQKTTINFVDSLVEMFVPLTFGRGTVYLRPTDEVIHDSEQYFEWFREIRPTIVQVVPSVYESMNQGEELEKIGSLKALIFSGEQLRKTYDHSFPIHNLYGTSELGGHSHSKCLTVETVGEFGSIGKPIQNVSCQIFDPKGRLCPPFVQGQLFVGGTHVVAGYQNQPDLTQAKFVPNPYLDGETLYDTGDLGAWNPAGEVEFHGRKDFQVKVRGVRIELSEIEVVLLRHPSVNEAIVTHTSRDGDDRLTAYFTGEEIAVSELFQWLAQWLPASVMPTGIHRLKEMPKNVTGKVDRKALPDPDELQAAKAQGSNPPQTRLEEKLAEVWKRVLHLEEVDVEASVYEQGVHSLNVVRLANQIGKTLGKEVPGRMLYQYSSIRKLASFLENDHGNQQVDVAAFKSATPRNYPLAPGQRQMWLHHQLNPEVPNNICLACRVDGEVSIPHLERAITEIVHRHEVLRTHIRDADGEPCQDVFEAKPFKVIHKEVADNEMQDVLTSIANSAFDLHTDLLFRVYAIPQSADATAIIVVFHHIISDGWSAENFVRELITHYQAYLLGNTPSLPALPFQYNEFALWHHHWLETDGQEAKRYWHQQLANGWAPADVLPLDFPWSNARKQPAASEKVQLSAASLRSLQQLALDHECTLFQVVLTSVFMLLSSYGDEGAPLSVGIPASGRQLTGLEDQLGFYVNPLVIKSGMDYQNSYSSTLERCKSTILEATQHQLYPFDQLVSELAPNRQAGRQPFFDVMVAWNQAEGFDFSLDAELGKGQWSRWPMPLPAVAKQALTFAFFVGEDRLEMQLGYDSGLFEEETIKLLIYRWNRLLELMTADLSNTVGGMIAKLGKEKTMLPQTDDLVDDFG